MDNGGIKVMTEIQDEDELYQRVHKHRLKKGRFTRHFFIQEIIRNNRFEMSVDLASLTTPPKDPFYTKKGGKIPSDNGVISHKVIEVKKYPYFDKINHSPTYNNPAHHDIKFQQDLDLDKVTEIARYIFENKKYKWEIRIGKDS